MDMPPVNQAVDYRTDDYTLNTGNQVVTRVGQKPFRKLEPDDGNRGNRKQGQPGPETDAKGFKGYRRGSCRWYLSAEQVNCGMTGG